jgi:hypothetical protein
MVRDVMVLFVDLVTMMIMMFLDEEMIHGFVIAKIWLLLIINTRQTKSNCFEPHIKLVHLSQTRHLLSTLMCTHPCFHETPGCLLCNLCSGKEEEEGVDVDLQESQDFDEFED